MALSQARFLLDENIPRKLQSVFHNRNLVVETVQSLGWSGIKNGDLAEKVQRKNFILVTRDRDFTFLWRNYQIKVIYLALSPSTLPFLQSKMEELFDTWNYDLEVPFLVLIQNDTSRFWRL
jgi:predicted nuclease of predicted toxin-antitoxin system